jgi:hypothetical protein
MPPVRILLDYLLLILPPDPRFGAQVRQIEFPVV